MIWFTCKKCGKLHGRPESQAGTFLFCECSYGNRVPWASTVAEPEPDATPAPIPLPPAPIPASRPRSYPERSDDRRPAERPLIRRQPRRENPRYCLNHEDAGSEHTCADCKAAFCAGCVVTVQGQTLCGPCKNFRIRAMNRPAAGAGLAIVSLVVGLVGGPVTFCLNNFNLDAQMKQPSLAWAMPSTVVGMNLPARILVPALLAPRQSHPQPPPAARPPPL